MAWFLHFRAPLTPADCASECHAQPDNFFTINVELRSTPMTKPEAPATMLGKGS
jgi:hypothetical protein